MQENNLTCAMDVLTAIATRRSIRKYTGEPIKKEMLDAILNAGFCAPSAHNLRPWEFVVVRDAAARREIAENGKYTKMAANADAVIAVCGDSIKNHHGEMLLNDCSAAAENMLLAAHGLGLGAVWCGVHPEMDLSSFLNRLLRLPEQVRVVALVMLGHPAEERPAPARFNAGCVHDEVFGQHDATPIGGPQP